jgi:hypothetical protein
LFPFLVKIGVSKTVDELKKMMKREKEPELDLLAEADSGIRILLIEIKAGILLRADKILSRNTEVNVRDEDRAGDS